MMLFARQDENVFDKISDGFRNYFVGQPVTIMLIVIGAAVVVLGVMALRSFLRERSKVSPAARTLFRELCQINGLSGAEVKTLKKMALVYEIRDPATLFFRRSLFESSSAAIRLDDATATALRKKLYEP